MPLLTPSEVQAALKDLPGWTLSGKAIERRKEFPDFAAAMRFVNRVAEIAERSNHHPDIQINYNKVVLSLTSHDSGGLTGRDTRMAARINELLEDWN